MSRFSSLKAVVLATILSTAPLAGHAASYLGEFWDAPSTFGTIDAAMAYADGNAATGTFTATMIDYPVGAPGSTSNGTSLANFLGVDFASYVGAIPSSLSTSVFRISGTFLPGAGEKSYSVGSDDGFALVLDGTEIARRATPRAFDTTTVLYDAGSGPVDFVLTYFENGGHTGVEFKINGVIVDDSLAVAPVPLPAALPLLCAALGGLGLRGRRKPRPAV